MATLNREAIEQEIGKRFEKIEKTLERTLEKTLERALTKAQEFSQTSAGQRATAAAERASEKLSTARETAKKSLDDVLLGLEHKGINVEKSKDLIQTVGRRVLERASEIAEDVRTQVVAKPYSPEWLRTVADVAATASRRAATQAAPVKPAGATEGDADLAAQASADGELDESMEDSAEERSAGTIVHSEPDVVTTSLAEASKSDNAADFAPAETKSAKASKKNSKVAKTKK